jgi:phosphate uptake regulator
MTVNQEPHGFTEELAALKERLFQMGQIAEDRLRLGLAALVARDVQSLAGVISDHATFDAAAATSSLARATV